MHLPSNNARVGQTTGATFPRIDADFWRRRAREIRELAEQMRYEAPRREMLRLAAECAALAERDDQQR